MPFKQILTPARSQWTLNLISTPLSILLVRLWLPAASLSPVSVAEVWDTQLPSSRSVMDRLEHSAQTLACWSLRPTPTTSRRSPMASSPSSCARIVCTPTPILYYGRRSTRRSIPTSRLSPKRGPPLKLTGSCGACLPSQTFSLSPARLSRGLVTSPHLSCLPCRVPWLKCPRGSARTSYLIPRPRNASSCDGTSLPCAKLYHD